MNSKFLASIALACLAFTACDDTTDTIGNSLSRDNDGVHVETSVFDVISQSIAADSVLSRNVIGHLGKVRDPETSSYITANFMAQFNHVEGREAFPPLDKLVTHDGNNITFGSKGTIKADSCELRLFVKDIYGDDRQAMKITAYEMDKPMNENRTYYSNFDPIANGYIRKDGVRADKVYSLAGDNVSKGKHDSTLYKAYITIKLNDKYTDKHGRTYSNFGSYILQKYYDDASLFKNALTFRNGVVPGFYFKVKSGLGNMAAISASQLNVHYRYKTKYAYTDSTSGKAVKMYRDTIYHQVATFWGTEEVLQTSFIDNDKATIEEIVNNNNCTFLKTPAGIFTELTLPVDDIFRGHDNDAIVSAKIVLPRINNSVSSDYAFDVPQNILMVPRDSLDSFFEQNSMFNNRTSYLATWAHNDPEGVKDNSYIFHNISGLLTFMRNNKANLKNWNKVVLVPVAVATTEIKMPNGKNQVVITKVSNDMSLTTTRLMKGTANNSPLKIKIIYSRFK